MGDAVRDPVGVVVAVSVDVSVGVSVEVSVGTIIARYQGDGIMVLESPRPFDLCVRSEELGLGEQEGLLLRPGCPLTNLCNRSTGDERQPWVSGLRLERFDRGCPGENQFEENDLFNLINDFNDQEVAPGMLFLRSLKWGSSGAGSP